MFSVAEQANSAVSGEFADPDSDGTPNLFEFTQSSNPKAPDQPASEVGLSNGSLTLTYRERVTLGGTSIWLQGSDDLERWTTYNTRQESSRIANTGFSTVTLLDPKQPPYELNKRFLRLRADRSPAALVASNKVAVGFNSPTDLYVVWDDLNTSELGFQVTHYDYNSGSQVVRETGPDITKASGLTATPQSGYYFLVSTLGAGSVVLPSNWATPPDRDVDGIPDYLERRGQTIITGTYDSNPDSWDTDGDGLSDHEEIAYYGTNPNSADTDGDGLPDRWELQYGFNPLVEGEASNDPDADGLTNLQESAAGTNPHDPDTDYDELNDYVEINTHLTNPLSEDTDGDGLSDGQEVNTYFTNALVPDTDGDTLPDGWEVTYQLNAADPSDAALDSDGDTISNSVEYTNNTSPRKTDTDNDGLSDIEEIAAGTRGSYWDSDYDGMSDIFEIANGLNPNLYSDSIQNTDGDSLTHFQEYMAGTNPNKADSDGDGVNDSTEITNGADPSDSSDAGQAPPASQQVPFSLEILSTGKTLVGNCAVCHNLQAQVGGRLITHGEVLQLRRDKAYEIKLVDKLTEWTNAGGSPPHTTTAKFTLWPKVQSGQLLTSSTNGQQLSVTKNGTLEYFIDNSADLLAQDKDWNDNLLQKKATIGLADLDIVHPASGELDENKEDSGDGGYVAIKRSATTPVTQLKSHARPIFATALYRLKFNSGGRYKIFRDAANTNEVISEQTQFSPATGLTLYLKGISKSTTRGGEKITTQIQLNSVWLDADSVSLTVVEAEFDVQVKFWIREQWIDVPFHPTANLFADKIAGGDDRNNSTSATAPYRVTQKAKVIPYQDLDSDGLAENGNTPGLSAFFHKPTSVPHPDQGYSATNRLLPSVTPTDQAPPLVDRMHIVAQPRSGRTSIGIRFHGEVSDPLLLGALDIDWDVTVNISGSDPTSPQYTITGTHDNYPAIEIDLEDSIGRRATQPYFWLHPLPSDVFSLTPGNSITIPTTTTGVIR